MSDSQVARGVDAAKSIGMNPNKTEIEPFARRLYVIRLLTR